MKTIGINTCFFFLILWGIVSCKEDDGNAITNISQMSQAFCDASVYDEMQMCTELPYEELEATGTTLRGTMLKSKRWKTGQTIRIKFLNGTQELQEIVKEHAAEWLEYANLVFEYVDVQEKADIKIAFKWDCDYSTWSYIGTDCKKLKQYEPSMNFGWLTTTTLPVELKRVILHEFGHALGLVHEHQHPKAGIQWDKEAVYEYYENMYGWNKSKVNVNIFDKYKSSKTNYSEFDEESIMLYAISEQLTLDGYKTKWNFELSDTDKTFISQMYPY